MARFMRFDKKVGCELLCERLQKIADNSTDKDFFKICSAIDELLEYDGLLDAVFFRRTLASWTRLLIASKSRSCTENQKKMTGN